MLYGYIPYMYATYISSLYMHVCPYIRPTDVKKRKKKKRIKKNIFVRCEKGQIRNEAEIVQNERGLS